MECFDTDVTYAVTFALCPNVKAMLLHYIVIASMMLAYQRMPNPFELRSNDMADQVEVAFADTANTC